MFERHDATCRWLAIWLMAWLTTGGTWSMAQAPAATAAAMPYGIQIGRETTYLTAPLRADGLVDYAEAINAEAGEGVTPQNNAASVLARIIRPNTESWSAVPDDVLKRMGVDADAPRAVWTDSPKPLDEVMETHQTAVRPWERTDLPSVAAWLDTNAAAFRLFAEASKRSRWWIPQRWSATGIPESSTLWLMPRSQAGAMWVRSMLRLGEGREVEAWADLAACLRIAELMRNSPDVIGQLMAAGIHRGTHASIAGMIEQGDLPPELLQQMDATLQKLSRWPTGGGVMLQSERYRTLTLVSFFAKQMQLAWDGNEDGLRDKFHAAGYRLPDWNRILRTVNHLYDTLQADQSRMSVDERAAHRRAIEQRLQEMEAIRRESNSDMRADATMDIAWLMPRVGETQGAYSDRVGAVIMMMMPPTPTRVERVFAECNAATTSSLVATALLRYRQDHGEYPADLKALVPGYLERGSLELENLEYERAAGGFLLMTAVAAEGGELQKITIRRGR